MRPDSGPAPVGRQPSTTGTMAGAALSMGQRTYVERRTAAGAKDDERGRRTCDSAQGGHVGEVSVALLVIEAIADDEDIGDLAPDVVHRDRHRARSLLEEEGARAQRGGLTRLEVAEQIGEAEPAGADALDHDDMAVLDGLVEVLSDADHPGRGDAG